MTKQIQYLVKHQLHGAFPVIITKYQCTISKKSASNKIKIKKNEKRDKLNFINFDLHFWVDYYTLCLKKCPTFKLSLT